MSTALILLMILIVCAASFIQGITGFGAGIFMMCFLPLFLGYKVSVSICSVIYLIQLPLLLSYSWKDTEWKKTLPVIIPFCVCAILSMQIMFQLNEMILNWIFCGILLFFAVLFLVSERKWRPQPGIFNSILWGSAAGTCNILGICGPPLVFYFHSIFPDNKKYFCNLQIALSAATIIMLVQNGIHGNFSAEITLYSVIAGLLSLLCLRVGIRIFSKISRHLLTALIVTFLILMAIVHLFV